MPSSDVSSDSLPVHSSDVLSGSIGARVGDGVGRIVGACVGRIVGASVKAEGASAADELVCSIKKCFKYVSPPAKYEYS